MRIRTIALAATLTGIFTVACGLTAEQDKVPAPEQGARVTGRVELAGLQPTQGITVVLIGAVSKKSETNADGVYAFDGLQPGQYEVVASAGDHTVEKAVSHKFSVAAAEQVTLDALKLTPTGDISGRVLKDGLSAGSLGVTVFIAGTSYAATCKDDGTFILSGVPVGTYDLNAQGRSTTMDEVKGVSVTFAQVASASDLHVTSLTVGQGQDGADGSNGSNGTNGVDGSDGTDGANGTNGLSCWDLDGDGLQDAAEDINGDGQWNALDCQGVGGGGGSTAGSTPPETQVLNGPAVSTTETTAVFTFAGADDVAVAYYQCRLDYAPFQTCTSPKTYANVGDGIFVFEVRAVDNLGNADPTPANWAWLVDTAANGPSWLLPDTGQSLCYDNSSTITCPTSGQSFFGQDAQYGPNALVFTDNGDGTVTHNVTGLMWQQSDDGVGRQWSESINYCGKLLLGGYTDWRLPNRHELQSIVDYGRYNPAIDTTYFPGAASVDYWSSSSYASDANGAWLVNFDVGYVSSRGKTSSSYARCVRQ